MILHAFCHPKSTFSKKFFQKYHQSVKLFGSRSAQIFCRSWSWSKQFAKEISRRNKSLLWGCQLFLCWTQLTTKIQLLIKPIYTWKWIHLLYCRVVMTRIFYKHHARIQRGDRGSWHPALENHAITGCLHRPTSHWNGVSLAGRWGPA